MLADHFPLLGLRVRTPRLELRLPDDDQLAALAELAAAGIHEPGTMPFLHPFTEAPPDVVARSVVQHHYRMRGELSPDTWALPLTVLWNGTVAGMQALEATEFAVTRQVGSGSWLGRDHQGKGIGTEMRAAALHLAFAGLGAEVARSESFDDNPASAAVSRRLGYADDGTARHAVLGRRRIGHRFVLTREAWERHRSVDVAIDGLEPCLPLLGADGPPTT
ncbi:RimJ/RimL family protein N-acetyltransferase [Prauserella isguenensis]|uniref:RimJ/RimL family protein N-acetyltransferase n=1 Tax=Prauserella isguenensis TaxID=1470180 RepID=A0A839RY49_9PSEU|nr:GNAT family protein [Prauserella isguenensis]MBB3050082.1 RimJ/RimL family protein N-acetyltransferase [Prauserella isguenensis]